MKKNKHIIRNFLYRKRANLIAWLLVDYLKMDFFIDGEEKPVKNGPNKTKEGRGIWIGMKHGDSMQKWYPLKESVGELHDKVIFKTIFEK